MKVLEFYSKQPEEFKDMFYPVTSRTFECNDKHYVDRYYMQDCLAIWQGMPDTEVTQEQLLYEIKLNKRSTHGKSM